ncbi:MAG TPA: glycosyltransferase family 4 protein [Pyrinomonadaceae bacterium]|nr:glycosyltransferase family 4 protein [Pyrinomonadaceae bacterium]
MPTLPPLRFAYLVSQYPAANHTFILREIKQLRVMGFEIRVASVSAPDRPQARMTAEERAEVDATYYVKSVGLARALSINLGTLFARPAGYLKGLAYALKLGKLDLRKTARNLFYFAESIVVGRWMERERLTHVHAHFSSTVALLLSKTFPVSISMTIHGPAEFVDPVGFSLREKIAASRFVCAISNYGRSQLMLTADARDWERIEVAPLGIEPEVFSPRPFRPEPDVFEVICVGRLAAVKAQRILVAAIELLAREGRAVRLRLVGDGADRASLEAYVAARGLGANVVFEGWLNEDEVLARLRGSDAFALASFAEGVPVVLMEAMAMEIPCVATRITGIPELIRDRVDGLLVAPASAEELAEALRRLMDDARLRRTLGAAGRVRVLEKYDLARNTAQLANIFARRLSATTAAIDEVDAIEASATHRAAVGAGNFGATGGEKALER